jgi:hypothetical protein
VVIRLHGMIERQSRRTCMSILQTLSVFVSQSMLCAVLCYALSRAWTLGWNGLAFSCSRRSHRDGQVPREATNWPKLKTIGSTTRENNEAKRKLAVEELAFQED